MKFIQHITNKYGWRTWIEAAIAAVFGLYLLGGQGAVIAGVSVFACKWPLTTRVFGNGRLARVINGLGLFYAVFMALFILGLFFPLLWGPAMAMALGTITVAISNVLRR